ncbi:MAG: hypothetical protein ACR2QM_16535 [Longimicrobiales bacterium]
MPMTANHRSRRDAALVLARVLGALLALAPVVLAPEALGGGVEQRLGVALVVHVGLAVPLVVALVIGWFRPPLGAVVYAILGTLYAITLLGRAGLLEMVVFSTPVFLIAALLWWAGPIHPRD